MDRPAARNLANWALGRGISSMTTDEVARVLDIPPDQVRRRLNAPMRRGEWIRPLSKFWMPVPLEYRAWGAPPGIDMVGPLMRHVGACYYVGWLSAAEIHGAAHHAPQVFQVATEREMRSIDAGRTSMRFVMRSELSGLPTVPWRTRSGDVPVSTVELTMLDVAAALTLVGGLNNAATVIVELAESKSFSVAALIELAKLFPAATFRRVGWIAETYGEGIRLDGLAALAVRGPLTPSRLDPSRSQTGPIDARWMVRLNATVEPDL